MSDVKELIKPAKIEYGEDETVSAFGEGGGSRRRRRTRLRWRIRWRRLLSDTEVEDDVLF